MMNLAHVVLCMRQGQIKLCVSFLSMHIRVSVVSCESWLAVVRRDSHLDFGLIIFSEEWRFNILVALRAYFGALSVGKVAVTNLSGNNCCLRISGDMMVHLNSMMDNSLITPLEALEVVAKRLVIQVVGSLLVVFNLHLIF